MTLYSEQFTYKQHHRSRHIKDIIKIKLSLTLIMSLDGDGQKCTQIPGEISQIVFTALVQIK